MSMFYLESDSYPSDLQCPCCHTDYAVVWQTEYGDPIFGQHDTECPSCGLELVMRVDSGITIDAIPKELK
jgi:transcription initiation factor IIE alpha subunit